MSVKSSSSVGEPAGGEVVRAGCLKKLKTMRKKFFVLRAETLESSARLEYYDSEKKYRSTQPPKRSISLKACFNINKRMDTKHKHVIALYTKDDCFCMVLESERDLNDWLKSLLSLQHGEDDGEPPKPTFEHVWQVTMLNKGLGNSRNIIGPYHLCFTDKTLSLVRKSAGLISIGGICAGGGYPDHVEFSLMSIRRCGHSDCFFYMEVGRSAVTGAGELWMQTEDTNIAQNMGAVILRAMSNNNKEDLAPKTRIRSSSANEASKPMLMQRRQTHSGQKSSYCSPNQDGVSSKAGEQVLPHQETGSSSTVGVGYSNISTPSTQHIGTVSGFVILQSHMHPRAVPRPSERRHSVSAGGAVTWSGMAHHQRTQSLPLAPHLSHVHVENNNPCYLPRTTKRANNNTSSSRCLGGRERCDSMPSRARTSSEGTTAIAGTHSIRPHLTSYRPQSLYARDISHSPPAGSPVSPASAACSTDSAGSSLSIDEPDAWPDYAETPMGRYGHSLTPDEPIVEENCDETMDNPYVPVSSICSSPMNGEYVPMAPLSSDDGYVDMSPKGRHADMSPAASSCSITSGTPSTDMRFSEYHLEKVSSYFTPSEEDDTSSVERPIRAYSVGSRPDVLKLRTKLDAAMGNHDSARVRAFSVGSRSKGVHNRVLPPHGHPPSTGGKSSSAPLLSGSHSHLGSQSSMERMDDLMEMDFSKPTVPNSGYVDMSPRTNRTAPLGYVEMKPGVADFTPTTTPDLPYLDMRPSASPVRPTAEAIIEYHPYMDMRPALATSPLKPSSIPLSSSSGSTTRDYIDMRPSTSPHKPSSIPKYNPHYVEMSGNAKLGTSPKNNNKAASPIQEEYMDMDLQQSKNTRTDRTVSGAARTQPVDLPIPKKSSEGYMDMSWSRHQRKSSLDNVKVVNVNNNNEDYMNMATGSSRKKERKGSKKEKNRSQPITIQSTQPIKNVSSQSPVSSFTSFLQNSTRKNSTGTPPKHPPNFLPLSSCSYSPGSSPFSSLRRPRSRNSSQRDSKDSSCLVTPTSESSTIFPFSPGSPIKPFHAAKSPDNPTRKCAVDVTSGVVRLSSQDSTSRPSPSNSDYARMSYDFSNKVSADYTEMNYDKPKPEQSISQVNQNNSNQNDKDSDYVNYCPAVPKPRNISGSSDDYGEYAVMRPVSIVQSTNSMQCTSTAPFMGNQNALSKQLSSLTMNNKPCVFKPIVEPKDDNRLGAVSPRPGDIAPHKSFENLRCEQQESSTGANEVASRSESSDGNYETLLGGSTISSVSKVPQSVSASSETIGKLNSRPSSVSSDKSSRPSSVSSEITRGILSRPSSVSSELDSTSSTIVGGSRPDSVNAELATRPSSVSSERELHYASLDLAPSEDDGTRSPKSSDVRQDAGRSPTPNSATGEPLFTYAEIDFIKSEGLKSNAVNNAKVIRH